MSTQNARPHPLLLIRHAKAGNRSRWQGPDDLRPLSSSGLRQADALVTQLAEFPLCRLITSPSLRCLQTLEPLAAARRIALEPNDALLEGTAADLVLTLLDRVAPAGAALCTHGDVVEAVLTELRELDVPLSGPSWAKKGATWILEQDEGKISSGRYLSPPEIRS
jgi:broad specificity phosphatase PhoE